MIVSRKRLPVVIIPIAILLCLQMSVNASRAPLRAAPLRLDQIDAIATFYGLCNGSNGACGDCDNNSHHAAWPHLDVTNCHRYCIDSYVSSLSCGADVTVSDLCPYKGTLEVEIHDCCTCDDAGGCDTTSRCSGTPWSSGDVVIDLTERAFLSLHGNWSDGKIPVRVYYNY